MAKKVIDFTEAEKKARLRDVEIEEEKLKNDYNGIDPEEVKKALLILNKATADKNGTNKYYIGQYKRRRNNIKFAQFIQANWSYALEINYFTAEEINFIVKILGSLQFKTNCIVDNINKDLPIPLNQSQIASKIGTSRSTISRIINNLVNKGMMVKAEGPKIKGSNVKRYSLYLNPNLIYCGDKDKIEDTLKSLFINSKDILKDFPIALF